MLSFIGSSGMTAMHRLKLTEHLRIVYVVFPPLRAPCAGNAIQISQVEVHSGSTAARSARPGLWKGRPQVKAECHRGTVKREDAVVQLLAGSSFLPCCHSPVATRLSKSVIRPVRGRPWIADEDADCIWPHSRVLSA